MKNLDDLTSYLFEQIESINDCELTDEELDKSIKRAEAINKVAENIIKTSELHLKTAIVLNKMGSGESVMPKALLTTSADEED